jgi:hypothetical protein
MQKLRLFVWHLESAVCSRSRLAVKGGCVMDFAQLVRETEDFERLIRKYIKANGDSPELEQAANKVTEARHWVEESIDPVREDLQEWRDAEFE